MSDNVKTCQCCKAEMHVSMFGKDSKRRDGLNPYCRACQSKKASAKWAALDAETRARRIETSKRWQKSNRAESNIRAKKYRDSHPERVVESKLKYRQNNRAKITEYAKKYYEENKPYFFAHAKARNAELIKRSASWANHSAIAMMYATRQYMQQETGTEWHVDHIIPMKGKNVSGLHTHNNLCVIPAIDNLRKSNKF